MKDNNNKEGRTYSSKIIADILASTTPLESMRVKTKFMLSDRIAGIMEAKGLSNKDLAARMGKSPSEISRWLSGSHNYTIDTLSEIAIALEVPVAAFFAPSAAKVVRGVQLSIVTGEVGISPYLPVSTQY